VKIEAYGLTDVGSVRQHNEDCFLIDESLGLYVVCDGMGGHAAGDLASKTAAETVQGKLNEHRDLIEAVARGKASADEAATLLRQAIQAASAAVHEIGRNDKAKRGMGTTCVAVLVLGGKGIMGHVGDSRLYLSRSGAVYQLSEDHTFIQEAIKRGMITPEQAEESPHQNLVTRAVGPNPSVLVDSLVFDLLPGDSLLLCSDGLHGYVKDHGELSTALRRPDELYGICKHLIDTANERGGADNITTVCIRALKSSEPSVTERADRVTAELSALGHIVLFSDLDMKELVTVANASDHHDYKKDEIVVTEGDVAETLFVIVSGAAAVTRAGKQIALLRAGDHFGEMALLSRRPRSATVRCLRNCQMLALERDAFYEIMRANSVIAGKFLWRLAQTLSLRLDDLYVLHEASTDTLNDRTTKKYGIFPSPFDRR